MESVINQSYKNIEIIIVNDCSVFEEDEKIILEYASKDNRIKYIKHKENIDGVLARMTEAKRAKKVIQFLFTRRRRLYVLRFNRNCYI